jgi:hypothetical protein
MKFREKFRKRDHALNAVLTGMTASALLPGYVNMQILSMPTRVAFKAAELVRTVR